MTTSRIAAAAVLSLLASGTALAQSAPSVAASAFYVGAGVGLAQHAIDTGNINQQLVDLGFTGATTSTSDDETAWKVFAGWQPWRNLGVEVSYFDLGKPGFTSVADRPGSLQASIKVTGWSVDLVPQYQWDNGFGVFGRIGYAYTESKADFTGGGAFRLIQTSAKETHNGWDGGAGVSYAFNKNVVVRAEWTTYPDIGGDAMGGKYDANVYAVSAIWRF